MDNEFEDNLYRKGILIYGVYGLVYYIFNNGIPDQSIPYQYFFELIMGVLTSIIFGLIGSYILYKFGKWIKGKASSIEIFSVLSYANIPIIIALILIGLLKSENLIELSINNVYTRNIILYISMIMYLKILIMGLIKYNRYSFKKSLINVSPILLINIGFVVLYFVIR